MDKLIRIGILENDRNLNHSLKIILSREERFEVCNQFYKGSELLHEVNSVTFDVLLVDNDLGDQSCTGTDVIAYLSEHRKDIICLMLTVYEDGDTVFKALSAGALGYIVKSAGLESIKNSILEVVSGGSPMSPSIARRVTQSFVQKKKINQDLADLLTSREKEILQLVSTGKMEKEVASELFISLSTVKNHIANIYKKLQVNTRVDALNKYFDTK